MADASYISPVVPQEILDKIIDDLHDDTDALAACALTSRSLRFCSQTHLFSSIHIPNSVHCKRLRSLLDANPQLLQYVHKLTLITFFDVGYAPSGTDISYILRALPYLKMLSLRGMAFNFSWSMIPWDTRKALFHAFSSPSLLALEIHDISSLPISLFGCSMHLNCLSLLVGGFCNNIRDLESADLSRTTIHTLEISCDHLDSLNVLLGIIGRSNSFSSRIKKLILCNRNTRNTMSLTVPFLTFAKNSLEVLQFLQVYSFDADVPGWAEYDFGLNLNMQRLELHYGIGFLSEGTLPTDVASALQKVADYLTSNTSAFQINHIIIRFIPKWYNMAWSPPNWNLALDIIAKTSQWSVLDKVLEKRRTSSEYGVTVELGMYLMNNGLQNSGFRSVAKWRRRSIR